MAHRRAAYTLSSETQTARFAVALGAVLRAGDTVLLDGDIGAGKTFLARALIQSFLDVVEDVPSPTFTLVQVYDTQKGEIWHSDLYRIGSTDELEELGLSDAFDTAICLIEWPDRLGEQTPDSALRLHLVSDPDLPDTRHMTMTWDHAKWDGRLPVMEDITS